MASFPFSRLPPEVRVMIYRLLFETAREDKIVTPDPTGSRHQNNLGHRALNLSDSLPFLRTCQLVHREATAALHGSNVFLFDDHPHNSDKHKIFGFNMLLPCCDYLTMYFSLVSIGKSNPEKFQHIHLDFSMTTFVWYPEEVDIQWRIFDVAGANFMGDAVEPLAAPHNLQTMSVSFKVNPQSMEDKWYLPFAMRAFFVDHSRLAENNSFITGIREFKSLTAYKSLTDYEAYDEDTALVYEPFVDYIAEKTKDMKAKMEVAYPQLNSLCRPTYDSEPAIQTEDDITKDASKAGPRTI